MPLSDREQRVLDDIERGLQATDPKLASSLVVRQPRSRAVHALVLAFSMVTAGLVLVLIGLVVNLVFLSILGYLLMVAVIVRVTSQRSTAEWISRIGGMRPPSREHPRQ